MPPVELLSAPDIARAVERLGEEIARDHPDGVVLLGVLKGGLILLSDLARAVSGIPATLDFIALSRFAPDSGRVRVLHDLDTDVTGRDVVIVDDLIDTGLTAAYLRESLLQRGARTVDLCVLLDRRVRRIVPLDVRYSVREIPDVFVIGYGLQRSEQYRNLPAVYEMERDVARSDPERYVDMLYRRGGPPGADNASEGRW